MVNASVKETTTTDETTIPEQSDPATISLPETVQIGPYVYRVRRAANIKNARGVELWGEISYSRHEIQVDEHAPPDRVRETFFHECLHGIAGAVTVQLKEREVVALSTGIVDFLLRNPDVAALYANGGKGAA